MPRIMRCEPYRAVHGLFLAWKDVAQPEAAIKEQLSDLKDTLEHYYKYDQIETWEIPSHKPYNALDRKLRDFIDDNDGEKTLLIVYYRGHATRDGRSLVLKLRNSQESPGLSWTAIQHKLMVDVEADVLLILDCCHAYSAAYSDLTGRDASSESRGCVGLLASVGDNEKSHLRGEHTFTKNLIAQLEESHAEPVEVARLSNGLEKRCRNWRDLRPEDAWKINMPRFQNLSIHIDRQMWLMRIDEQADADKTPRAPPAVMQPRVPTTRADAPQPAKPETYPNSGPVTSPLDLPARKTAAEFWTERQHMLQLLLDSEIDRVDNERLVKVAILSSGVDETSALVSAAARRGQLEAHDFTGSKSCADELGVGTHSVNLMLQLTKYAKIYAAKVATSSFSQKVIVREVYLALRFCIDTWDVDLIVLPFWFEQPVFDIELQIKRGHAKGKRIMAAAEFDPVLNSHESHLSFPACMPGVMAIVAADGLGRLAHPIFPPKHSPSVEFSTLGQGVPFFEDDETAPSWRHCRGVEDISVAVVVTAALLCNARKYAWCCVAGLPDFVRWRKMPLTRKGSQTSLRLMSMGFSAGRANGLAARTVDALPDWGAAY
ncbi:Peptidase S8/S53, subtilisin/kexin/sedolisin [Metarhizium robertsii ARSEF 23]|uniref:Peptidase S8/S53, subtilisin/kexin/sedolisin n=1 Tax=Metarhizium robertsii (strain ARSEF 23 / ATCC MYA-3075) TaxID=655844 RepID=E9F9D2_METRA|nr:Peptidase S8/S53, subtilisin/kexin/sedolisin [Metarhizium robertsii ARSEF 23]EFY95585.1 Peptidase S8/S53, subtilisin/kexin/sedolisin [Metarhizium robertsii ARSEF 23]